MKVHIAVSKEPIEDFEAVKVHCGETVANAVPVFMFVDAFESEADELITDPRVCHECAGADMEGYIYGLVSAAPQEAEEIEIRR